MKELTREMFVAWGKSGGKKRAKKMDAKSRSKSARKAALARWKKGRNK